MREHAEELLNVLEFVYGDRLTFFIVYDWSSGHAKYPEGALNVNVMQAHFGRKQERNAK